MGSISNNEKEEATQQEAQNAKKVKMTVVAMGKMLGKIKLELGFARKEIAFGKLCPEDFSKMFQMFREICQPVIGHSNFWVKMQTSREHQAVMLILGCERYGESNTKVAKRSTRSHPRLG